MYDISTIDTYVIMNRLTTRYSLLSVLSNDNYLCMASVLCNDNYVHNEQTDHSRGSMISVLCNDNYVHNEQTDHSRWYDREKVAAPFFNYNVTTSLSLQ